MYFRRNLKSIFIKCPWKALKLFINPKGRNLIRTTSKLRETVAAFWRQLGHTPKTVYKVAVADSFKEWTRYGRNHEAVPTGFFFFFSDFSNGGDGMLATSSNGSQYSGSRVETPVSYVGDDDDDDDDFNENDDDDWCPLLVDYFLLKFSRLQE